MERKFKIGDRVRINDTITAEMQRQYDDNNIDEILITHLSREGIIEKKGGMDESYSVKLKGKKETETFYDFEMRKISENTKIKALKKELIRRQQNGI